jgi:hypothetical protein
MASAHVRTLEDEVVMLKGMVRERDEALSGTGQEIEEKACEELRDEVVGWQTHAEGKPLVVFSLWPQGPRLMLTQCLCFRVGEAAACGPGDGHLVP